MMAAYAAAVGRMFGADRIAVGCTVDGSVADFADDAAAAVFDDGVDAGHIGAVAHKFAADSVVAVVRTAVRAVAVADRRMLVHSHRGHLDPHCSPLQLHDSVTASLSRIWLDSSLREFH